MSVLDVEDIAAVAEKKSKHEKDYERFYDEEIWSYFCKCKKQQEEAAGGFDRLGLVLRLGQSLGSLVGRRIVWAYKHSWIARFRKWKKF